jgi:hypothetical protein
MFVVFLNCLNPPYRETTGNALRKFQEKKPAGGWWLVAGGWWVVGGWVWDLADVRGGTGGPGSGSRVRRFFLGGLGDPSQPAATSHRVPCPARLVPRKKPAGLCVVCLAYQVSTGPYPVWVSRI